MRNRWIFPQEICLDRFIYMTCVRHPVSRIKSSVKFHVKQTEAQVWCCLLELSLSSPWQRNGKSALVAPTSRSMLGRWWAGQRKMRSGIMLLFLGEGEASLAERECAGGFQESLTSRCPDRLPCSIGSQSVDNFYIRSLAGRQVFLKVRWKTCNS